MIALTYQARSTPYSLPAVRFPPAASRALAEARALIEQLGHVGVVADDSKILTCRISLCFLSASQLKYRNRPDPSTAMPTNVLTTRETHQ